MTYKTEDHLTKEQQQEQGAFYTPRKLALKMAKKLNWQPGQTVLDPCVGKGGLFLALKELNSELTNNLLYGVDIDPVAIRCCIELFPGGHFQVGNALTDPLTSDSFWEKEPLVEFSKTKTLF